MHTGDKLSGMFIDDRADGYVEYEDRFGNILQTESEEAKAQTETKLAKRKLNNIDEIMQFNRDKQEFVPGSFTNGKLYQ